MERFDLSELPYFSSGLSLPVLNGNITNTSVEKSIFVVVVERVSWANKPIA